MQYSVEKIQLYQAYDCLWPFGSQFEILARIAAYTAKSDEWKRLMPAQFMDQEFDIDSDKLQEMRRKVAAQFQGFADGVGSQFVVSPNHQIVTNSIESPIAPRTTTVTNTAMPN